MDLFCELGCTFAQRPAQNPSYYTLNTLRDAEKIWVKNKGHNFGGGDAACYAWVWFGDWKCNTSREREGRGESGQIFPNIHVLFKQKECSCQPVKGPHLKTGVCLSTFFFWGYTLKKLGTSDLGFSYRKSIVNCSFSWKNNGRCVICWRHLTHWARL